MLCNHHKNTQTPTAIGRCQSCGGSTSSLGFKLCLTCSVAKKQCQMCRCSLLPHKDADK